MMTMSTEAPIAPTSHYGCGGTDCVSCYGNLAWRRENLPYYWMAAQFDDGICPDCSGDELDHDADGVPGNFTYTCLSDYPEAAYGDQ